MPRSGFRGISFPFRVGPQGGVVMSTTSMTDPTHIKESIQQIFGTNYLERVMEPEIFSTVSMSLYEPNDDSLQSILRSRMVDDITRLEERVEVSEDDIEFFESEDINGNFLYATINYKIIKYETWYTSIVRVGEISNE